MKHLPYIIAMTTIVALTGLSPVAAADAPTVNGIEHKNVGRKGQNTINEDRVILSNKQMDGVTAGNEFNNAYNAYISSLNKCGPRACTQSKPRVCTTYCDL